MDRAYEDNKTQEFAKELDFAPVVPPKCNRKEPWNYDRELYKQGNGAERFFRCVCTRYGKPGVIFSIFIYLATISIALRRVNIP
jgi:hypothetical protein